MGDAGRQHMVCFSLFSRPEGPATECMIDADEPPASKFGTVVHGSCSVPRVLWPDSYHNCVQMR